MSDAYCKNCGHWTPENKENYEKYGRCDFAKGYLNHRSESCEKFERKVN